jgi:hypothetical protein
MKTTKKKAPRRSARRTVLTLSQRVERLEKSVLFKAVSPVAKEDRKRYVKLGEDGKPTTGAHVAVFDRKTGLTWSADIVGAKDGQNWEKSMAAAKACRLMGHEDWRAPTIEELLSIIDYTKCDPAVDSAHFRLQFGWEWTSTVAAAPSGCAWFVNLYNGYSSRNGQDYGLHVRAVRAGQSIDLFA